MDAMLSKLLDAIKGLTLTNVLIIVLLAAIAFPAYLGWRVINDEKLMGVVFSNYREIRTKGECAVVFAQPAGGIGYYAVTNSFAERNAEFWSVIVRIRFEPDDEAIEKYCAALGDIIEYARDPETADEPTFPGSMKPIFPPAYKKRGRVGGP